MENHFCEHQRPGKDQTVCAWGIVLALAILFGALELLWPHTSIGTSGPQVATIQPAFDREQANDNDLNGKAGLRQSEFALER
jgi:hypothetical protein